MPQERLVEVGVVVDGNQVRGSIQPAADQYPRCQGLMVVIDNIDILVADTLVSEQVRQAHGICHPAPARQG